MVNVRKFFLTEAIAVVTALGVLVPGHVLAQSAGFSNAAKLRPIVIVTDPAYAGGAKCDGTTDDVDAIQAAITAADTVELPNGTCAFSSTLTLDSNTRLVGRGMANSTLKYTGAGIAITTGAADLHVVLEGMRLQTTTGTHGFRVQGTTSWVRVLNVQVEGFSVAGAYLTGTANNIHVAHSVLTANGANATADSGGILSDGNANGVSLVGNNINSNDGWGIANVNTARGWLIAGNVIEGNALGGIHGRVFTGLTIHGNYFENLAASKYQIFLENLGAGHNSGVSITGNLIGSAAAFDATNIQYTDGLTFTANHVRATRYVIDGSGGNNDKYTISNNDVASATAIYWDGTSGNSANTITAVAPTRNAGSGTGTFVAAGRFARSSTAVGTDADLVEKVLGSIPYPANTLTANGQAIRVTAWGTFAANGNTKTLRMRANGLGSSTVSSASGAYNGLSWRIELVFQRTGAATQDNSAMTYVGTTIAANDVVLGHTVALNGDATLVITGENGFAAANDIVLEGFIAEYVP